MLLKRKYFQLLPRRKHIWTKPEGQDTGINVYNCVTRNKQPLIVKNKNLVTWYTCGPTVYDTSHIGHASSYVKLDIIQRILRNYFSLNLVTVMNITDIDDKIIAKSRESGVSTQEIAKKFEGEFWNDLNSLGVRKPDCVLRVTQNIDKIIIFIEKLVREKKAYVAEDSSVYFYVQFAENYGKLQNISEEPYLEPSTYKKSPMDFALWKSTKSAETSWDSPWGRGRPGWHVECSTLASQVFGPSIDIHAGGIDLRFPHHENEEAQSCGFHNTSQWVNYWLHTGHLHLKGSEKMSKSLKNTVPIQAMLKTTPAEVFRIACVMSHYRSGMEFSEDFMATAANLLRHYKNFVSNCNDYANGYLKANVNSDVVTKLLIDSFCKLRGALADDFNTPGVINVLNEIVSTVNAMLNSSSQGGQIEPAVLAASALVQQTLSLLGVQVQEASLGGENNDFVEVMNILNNFRQSIRQIGIAEKNKSVLQLCDGVRDELKRCGVNVKDHGKVSSWSS